MPQMKTKKISADEAQAKRKEHVRETDRGTAVVKAAKAPASWDKEARSARFVMSTAAIDRYGDIVVTEGLDTTEFERNPVGLLFHNSRTWPVANWANLEKIIKGRPPRLEGDFVLLPAGGPIKEIEETEWMLSQGGMRACSIGFIPDWSEVEMILDDDERWTGGLRFVKSELVECSYVAVPAAPGALVKHADNMRLAKELIEDILDNWQRTPEGLLMPRADYEKAYKVAVEKLSPVKPAPAAPELPLADDVVEAAEAKQREIALEIAKVSGQDAAVDGSVVSLEGEYTGKFVASEGRWKSAGELTADETVNQVLVCKKAGEDATTFEVVKAYSKNGWKRDDKGEWAEVKAPVVVEGEIVPDGSITLKLDTAEAEAGLGRMKAVIVEIQDRWTKLFSAGAPTADAVTRAEPTFDAPALPSAEAIAAARTKASEMRARLKAAGRI
jgi:hypothetical protein